MKAFAIIVIALCVLGCAHTGPSEKFCALEKQTANPQPCIPHYCYGWDECIGNAIDVAGHAIIFQ